MLTTLIGVTGKAGSGKDTVGEMLWGEYGFVCSSFADPVKQAASIIFGVELDKFYDRVSKEAIDPYWGITRREMLTKLGTDACRNVFGQDVWTKRWLMSFNEVNQFDDVVVTDVRFEDEAALIRSMGGTIIHLSRPASERGVKVDHVSEAGVKILDGDYGIDNNGTLGDLLKNVCLIVDDLERRGKYRG